MKYTITREGINQVQNYNACLSDLTDFISDQSDKVNEITAILDSCDIAETILEDIVGELERDQIFSPNPEKFNAGGDWPQHFDPKLLEFDDEDFEEARLADLKILLDKDYIEELEDEPSHLKIIAGNLGVDGNLIDAICKYIDGLDEDDLDLIRDEIKHSELFTKSEERSLSRIIDTYCSFNTARDLQAITLTLKKEYHGKA